MKVLEFRFAYNDDDHLYKHEPTIDRAIYDYAWSRPYEYQYAFNWLKYIDQDNRLKVHNSAWGSAGCHIDFRVRLDLQYECLHSDVQTSNAAGLETYYYDILQEEPEFENKFDAVLNISTLEHLGSVAGTTRALLNLLKQVRPGGLLICSFDYPRVNVRSLEQLFGVKCNDIIPDRVLLDGATSIHPMPRDNHAYDKCKNLNIVYIVIEK